MTLNEAKHTVVETVEHIEYEGPRLVCWTIVLLAIVASWLGRATNAVNAVIRWIVKK